MNGGLHTALYDLFVLMMTSRPSSVSIPAKRVRLLRSKCQVPRAHFLARHLKQATPLWHIIIPGVLRDIPAF
jgi:hypothetical protein